MYAVLKVLDFTFAGKIKNEVSNTPYCGK